MATWSNKQTNKHKIKMRILGGAIKRKRFKASKGKTSPSHNCHTHTLPLDFYQLPGIQTIPIQSFIDVT